MDVTPLKNHLFTFCESRSRLVVIAKLGQALWSTPRTCLPTRHSLQWRFASVLCPTAVRNFLCFGAVDHGPIYRSMLSTDILLRYLRGYWRPSRSADM